MTGCIYLGTTSRASAATGINNEIVVGNNTVGLGSNTTIIGTTTTTRSRIQGTVETSVDFENVTNGAGVLLRAPNGTRYRITVDNAGAIIATAAP
jgi:hypothetical protein